MSLKGLGLRRDKPTNLEPVYCYKTLVELECFEQRPPRGRAAGCMDLQGGSRIVRIAATFAIVTICLVALPGWADQLFPGDYLSSYKRAAEQGERKAQYLLGLRYERGVPGEPDFAAAAHWYAKAAVQGMRLAAFRLALIYQHGRGVPRDPGLAAKWYRKAAEEGLAEAQFNLGYLYERGIGVPVDGKSSVVGTGARPFKGCTRPIGISVCFMQPAGRSNGMMLKRYSGYRWYRTILKLRQFVVLFGSAAGRLQLKPRKICAKNGICTNADAAVKMPRVSQCGIPYLNLNVYRDATLADIWKGGAAGLCRRTRTGCQGLLCGLPDAGALFSVASSASLRTD